MGVSQKKQKKNENFFDNSLLVRKEPNDDARHRYKKYSDYSVSLHPSQVMKGIGERNPGIYSFIYECLLTEKPLHFTFLVARIKVTFD